MIHLDVSSPIGSGVDRIVYPHPNDPGLCIKIAKCDFENNFEVKGIRDKFYYLLRLGNKAYFDYNYTDTLFAEKLAARGDSSILFRHLPQCYGYVETNLGRGVLWQRISDYDGSKCITLKDCYFTPGLLGDNEQNKLWDALNDFFDWQIDNSIMLREMAFVNTLVCRLDPERIRLYHVDAIGCVDLIPLADYALWFARMRVKSKVRRFRKHIVKWLGPPHTT